MSDTPIPPAPSDVLGDRALRFWADVHAEYDPDPAERVLLIEMVRAIDEADVLREVISDLGPVTFGSKGQPVINPAVAALASTRKAIESLSKRLELFEPDEEPDSPRTVAAREAARARWRKDAEKRRSCLA